MKTTAFEKPSFPLSLVRMQAGCLIGIGLVGLAGWGMVPSFAAEPILEAVRQADQLRLRWSTNANGYVVEQAAELAGPWTTADGTVQPVGDRFELGVGLTNRTMFFRLRRATFARPPYMGLVQNHDSAPLANVVVGELQLTDETGIFSGAVLASTSGWITVQAPGHATAYVKSTIRAGETGMVEAWLTPFADQQELRPGGSARLFLGDLAAPTLDVSFAATDFTNAPVILGLAAIDPLNVGPLFANLASETNRYLAFAFALEAFARDGAPLPLTAGSLLEVNLRDAGGTNAPPLLAWFDPNTGTWQLLTNACQRTAPDRLVCTLDRLSSLFGLFAIGAAPYLTNTGAVAPLPSQAGQPRATPAASEADYDQGYKQDQARLAKRLQEIQDLLEQGIPIDPTQDPQVQDILNDMAQHARDYAAANAGESGKTKLLLVAQHAILLGQEALGQQLMNEATALANAMAQQLLSTGDCGRVREMLHMLEQLMLMAGDPALIQALQDKIEQLFRDCDLWIGTVRFVSFSSSQHPGVEELKLQSGGCWTELHDLKLATHAGTHVLKGEDHLTLNFPEVSFRDPTEPCELSISFYGQPAGASLWLNCDGTYDGYVFNVGDLVPAAGTQPINVTQRQLYQYEDDDGNCHNLPNFPLILPFPNYYSVLMHGFLDSPPITLQEMLESGTRSDNPLGETIRGYEAVNNEYPTPNYGRYPFTSGLITWTFIHVKKLLPLERIGVSQ